MKFDMKKVGFAVLAAAIAVLPMAKAQAQGNSTLEPAVVFSISSVDEQLKDLRHLMTAADMEGMADLATEMAKGFTEPFDTAKPIGGFLTLDSGMPKVVAFLPVNDLDSALKMVSDQLGEIEEDGDLTIASMPNGESLYIKEANGFAFLSDSSENLETLPENPRGMLDGLNNEYNFAVRLFANNIPQDLKDMAIGFMEQGFEEAMSELENVDPDAAKFQRDVNEVSMQSMIEMIEQMDSITIGLGIDEDAKSTYLDVTVTALPNTELADQISKANDVETRFAGFLMEGAAASLHFASEMSESDIASVDQVFGEMEGFKTQMMEEIEAENDLDDMERAVVERIFDDMMDVMKATLKGGVIDGGAVLTLDDQLAFAGGMALKDGLKIEALAKELVGMAKEDAPEEIIFELDKETYSGVKMHVITIPVPDDEDEAAKIFGNKVVLVLGTSEDAAYLAMGRDPATLLKKCMDASKQGAPADLPNSQFNINLAPLMAFAASMEDNEVTAMLSDALEGSELDGISITSTTVKNGARTRINLEDDVIKLLGVVGMELGAEMQPGF